MNVREIFVDKEPVENPDWGCARNCRVLLRRPSCEFSQSVFSTEVNGLTAPNRDYAYEGFSAEVGGENWRLLDSLPFALYGPAGEKIFLKPLRVRVFPWKAQYFYEAGKSVLCAEYYLFTAVPRLLTVSFSLDPAPKERRTVLLRPLADVRHMYAASTPFAHSSFEEAGRLVVEKDGCRLVLSSPNVLRAVASKAVQQWFYKLGDGGRRFDGGLRFAGEERQLFVAGELELYLTNGGGRLFASVDNRRKKRTSVEVVNADERRELLRLGRYAKAFSPQAAEAERKWGRAAAVALEGRLLCLLDKFGWNAGGKEFPDAGAYWFRNAWFRDALEGINIDFGVYHSCRKRALRAMVLAALELEKNGLVPNKLPERAGEALAYNSLDATLLAYLAALKLLRRGRDREVLESLRKHARATISSFAKGSAGVFMDEKGLLRCPAGFGWMDSMRSLQVGAERVTFPARVSDDCVSRAFAEFGGNAQKLSASLNAPDHYLAECNALWLAFLRELLDFVSEDDLPQVGEIVEGVEANYKQFFVLPNGFVAHDVCGGARAGDESSAGLVSMALLPSLFSDAEVEKALSVAEERLFVRRGERLFGVLCRNWGQRIFLADAEYHGAVVWPRDSPYLLALLERLGRTELAEQLVLSNLEHQQSEAAVFFNSELFSLAEGANPSPGVESAFPVPVKNPCQYRSQWTQPMLDFIDRQRRPAGRERV
ncbi:MAG: amylo-alpha-1,6-glucosidase [Candidatus Micrarchaeota archaeon]